MDTCAIFQGIVDRAVLTDEDKEALLKNRGIPADVAKQLKLRSVTEELLEDPWIQDLPEDYRRILWAAHHNKAVLIPFLDPEGRVYHLRPHKFNFPESGSQVYIPYELLTETKKLVIAESEFKAVASCIMGVPAIGIPGISSFSKTKLHTLVDLLIRLGCKDVVICFDNEIKDDPSLPKYKPNFRDRYDTIIYEYIMAYALNKEGFHSTIARLKDEWRVNGKADIDGVLSMGINPEEYRLLVSRGVLPNVYRKSWKFHPIHTAYISRRVDRFFYKGPIHQENGAYYYVEPSKKPKDEESLEGGAAKKKKLLSNFTFKIVYIAYGEGKAERYCSFKSKYGVVKELQLRAEMMVSRTVFQRACFEMGDFEYIGTDQQLSELMHYAFLHQDGREIVKLKSYGYDEKIRAWFFENGAYRDDHFFEVEDRRIIWIDEIGYMLPPIQE